MHTLLTQIYKIKQLINKADFLDLIDFDDSHIIKCIETGNTINDVDTLAFYKETYQNMKSYYNNLDYYISEHEDIGLYIPEVAERVERVKLYLARKPLIDSLDNLIDNNKQQKRMKL